MPITATCAEDEIHVGDAGTELIGTILDTCDTRAVADISAATTKEFVFKRPDGTTFTKTAVFVTDGSDGQIRYLSVAADFDMAGWWRIQGHVIEGSQNHHTKKATFKVLATLA